MLRKAAVGPVTFPPLDSLHTLKTFHHGCSHHATTVCDYCSTLAKPMAERHVWLLRWLRRLYLWCFLLHMLRMSSCRWYGGMLYVRRKCCHKDIVPNQIQHPWIHLQWLFVNNVLPSLHTLPTQKRHQCEKTAGYFLMECSSSENPPVKMRKFSVPEFKPSSQIVCWKGDWENDKCSSQREISTHKFCKVLHWHLCNA